MSRGRPHTPWDNRFSTGDNGRSLAISRCPDCGKLRYRSRAEAKRAARQLPFAATRAYRCGEYWHLTSQDSSTTTSYRERESNA